MWALWSSFTSPTILKELWKIMDGEKYETRNEIGKEELDTGA
jgi:hypothetical protein